MGRNYPRVASEGGRGRPMTKSWMTLTSRNTEPPKDAEDSSPGGGGRAESRTWRKEVRALPEKGGSADSSSAGATISPEAPRPHLPSSVHAALVLGHLPARSTASGLNSDWERPLQNIFPRRWKHLRCLIRLCLPSTAYVSL